MGTRERQEREREIVRRAIVDAARELFIAEGFGKVSMRRIAERIEYSPAAIYSYFPGKDDIFYALAEEGFRLLCAGIEPLPDGAEGGEGMPAATPTPNRSASVSSATGRSAPAAPSTTGAGSSMGAPAPAQSEPLDLIRRALNALYRFSQAHPEYYALMFLDRSVPTLKGLQDRVPRFAHIKARIMRAVQQCIDTGVFPAATEPYAVFRVLTTAAHGAATTNVCGRLRDDQRGDALAHDLIELTIAGLRAGVPLTFVGAPCGDQPREMGLAADGTEPVEP